MYDICLIFKFSFVYVVEIVTNKIRKYDFYINLLNTTSISFSKMLVIFKLSFY